MFACFNITWENSRDVNKGKLYVGKVKLVDLAYNRRETRDKQLLGRDPGRSWCHCHTT